MNESYNESMVRVGESVETVPAQILGIADNPSEEIKEYLKNKIGKVTARVVGQEANMVVV